MSIIVTGGAGFIGSCIVRTLNEVGIDSVIIVDNISKTSKWKNIVGKRYVEYIHKDSLLDRLPSILNISHVIHMGACSSTVEKDFDYLYANNVEYTKMLWRFCVEKQISFIYASSAATYGAGTNGFSDELELNKLVPLNGYGYSKHIFDLWAEKQTETPKQYVGLKFFNIYGPNEYCKGTMASVIFHGYKQIKETGRLNLFKSYDPKYKHGEQLRDFIYVKDVCSVIEFFMANSDISGIFNVGTGKARSFEILGNSIFKALGRPANIEYIDMPRYLHEKYQNFTEADIAKLRNTGYTKRFFSLEDGVIDYVHNYLDKDFLIF